MIQSKFDMLVNRILKESLMGGSFTSSGGVIAKPQETQADNETTDQENDQEQQLPIPSAQQTVQKTPQQQNVTANNSNDADVIKALMSQMKDDSNKQEEFQKKLEEFQKKLIATQTAAAMKTVPTQQTTSATTNPPPIAGNLDTKQVLSNLMGLK